MQKPLIGITAGEIYNLQYPWAPVTHGQRHTFIDSVIRAGGVPVILPLTDQKDVIDNWADKIDGLLLSSGNDVHPEQYGEKPYKKLHDPSTLRDEVELRLLEKVLEKDIPILAICRGMQLLNIIKGGTLYQDINTDLPRSLNHNHSVELENMEYVAHSMTINQDSKLYKILGVKKIDTNTQHHQAIKKLGKGLKVTSRSDDDIIEAIETDDNRFIIGVQGHPESLDRVLPEWDKLFEAFVTSAKN
jgi:putative glutamine amidotransferase